MKIEVEVDAGRVDYVEVSTVRFGVSMVTLEARFRLGSLYANANGYGEDLAEAAVNLRENVESLYQENKAKGAP